MLKRIICIMIVCLLLAGIIPAAAMASEDRDGVRAEEILAGMSLDEKLSQMIIPALRTWNEKKVTDLSEFPELKEALGRHQYGGIMLYGTNISGTEQTARLISDLQVNNAANENVSTHIPYFISADEEGGNSSRLISGTRMTGSMAIGATGEHARDNARLTGEVKGEELAALGFNIDFAPVIDVNNNAANPVIGIRSFSDDPQIVSELGPAYAEGLTKNHVIATYKHFPGHGDTETDSHIGTPTIEKTYDQLKEVELIPFKAAIAAGAEMIMTAHITFPLIDDEEVFGDGVTKGYFPATMSKKMITQILRGDLGFDGVVVADALEMDAIRTAGLVPGEKDSTEYKVNIAEHVINAGVDILLLPQDMTNADAVTFYDDYIAGLMEKIKAGSITEARIDESVLRILNLKEEYGILDTDVTGTGLNETIANAQQVVGSQAHHKTEMSIAQQAVTLLKNEGGILPFDAKGKKIILVGNNAGDSTAILYAVRQLQEQQLIDPEAKIENLITGEISGNDDSQTVITIDYYFDPNDEGSKLHYTDNLKSAVARADLVICLSKLASLSNLAADSAPYLGISGILADTHSAGGRFVLLSDHLPYDAARYQQADAILLAYMGTGLDIDPAARADGSANQPAYNANVNAALHILFGDGAPVGKLPVNIPAIISDQDGSIAYDDENLYERGFGLSYDR